MSDSLIGKQLGDYLIRDLLGRGGMARVYSGYDARLDRLAAVKVINNDFSPADRIEYFERFQREARSIARLNHPNIVGIYQFGQYEDSYYMAMVFVEGRDLRQILREYNDRREIMPMADVLNVVRGIGSALDYAHSRGVIHRDVKPSNIMLNPENRAILTDFGLALNASEGTLGETFGSAHYIAPEQAVSSAKAVPQSDLYSLGICTYEMLTGKVPFDDPSAMSVALKHLQDPPPPPSLYNANLSPAIEHVVLRVLDKDPTHRYNTGAELAQALQDAVDNQNLADTSKLPVIELRTAQAATAQSVPQVVPVPPADETLPPTSPKPPDPPPPPPAEPPPSIPPPPVALPPSTFVGSPSVQASGAPRRFGLIPLLVVLILIVGGLALAGRAAGLIGASPTATGTLFTGTPGALIAGLPTGTLAATESLSTRLSTSDATRAVVLPLMTDAAILTLTPTVTDTPTVSPTTLPSPSATPTLVPASDTPATFPATSTITSLEVTLNSAPTEVATLAPTTSVTADATLSVTAFATVPGTVSATESVTLPATLFVTELATSAATVAATSVHVDVLLIYDKDQFNLINETTHAISVKNIVFVQHSTPERRFSAQSWTLFLPSLSTLPPQDCFQASRSNLQQVPAIKECAKIIAYWSAGDPTQFWVAANANAAASFDVQINGVTATTCAIAAGRCPFALPN